MPLLPISFSPSQNIRSVLYDPDEQTLVVRFYGAGGRAYRYPGVTGDEANGFSQALSANDHLLQIVIPTHQPERLSPEETLSIFGEQ